VVRTIRLIFNRRSTTHVALSTGRFPLMAIRGSASNSRRIWSARYSIAA
jgi:hypothetical protein